MAVAIVDYRAGNLRSIENALQRLGAPFTIVRNGEDLIDANAERLIFPGVGEAGSTMDALRRTGLEEALRSYFESGRPMLSICVGAQVALASSEERNTPCLGLIAGVTRRFDSDLPLKVPHIGWAAVRHRLEHPLFAGIPQRSSFYFLHSYWPDPVDETVAIAWSQYGLPFTAGLQRDNLCAVQFHPERSGRHGLRLLDNFLAWQPDRPTLKR